MTESTYILGSSVLCRAQTDSGEGCIVLQKPDRLVASLLSFRTFSRRLQYANFVLQGKNAGRGVCKHLMPDVAAPKAHQNNRSYVSSANLPSDSLCKNLAWWAVARRAL